MAKILVVDDRPINRLFLSALLKHMAHDVHEAADGREALEAVHAHRPDLVISDIMMPVMDGFAFARAVHADPVIGGTPVIFYTSTYRAPEAAALAASCGVRTVLRKPADPADIMAAIEAELGIKPTSLAEPAGYPGADVGIVNGAGRGITAAMRQAGHSGGQPGGDIHELGPDATYAHRLNSNLTMIVELMLDAAPEKGPQHVVELFFNAAHRMINSEYATLLIPGKDGALLHVQTKGVNAGIYAGGRGILSETLSKAWSVVRRPVVGQTASVNAGLAPGHPAVENLLASSVASKGQVYGWIMLANKTSGDYTEDDARMLATLATQLAVFYETANVHDALQRHAATLQLEVVRREEAENEVRAQERQLAQAQKMETVGQLTGGLAHDFNNLLTVIKGASEDLQEDIAGQPHLAAQVKMIQAASQRGADLVRQLMSFSRKQELNPAAIDLSVLLENTARLLRKAVTENITINVHTGTGLPAVFVDAGTLENVILNLALNARDAMPTGGTLTITTSAAVLDDAYAADNAEVKPGSYVLLSVCDTGAGMPAEVAARAFEPFFTTKETGKGTGLGLSMVYGFVKQSGGHVKIYSEPGHGTAVKLYLPPASGLSAEPVKASAPETRLGTVSARILLVEDDDLVRASVEMKLMRLGHTVTAVTNPTAALETLDRSSAFDLVFTDIIMPGPLTGADLAREVLKRWPEIKVLATSGYTENALHGKIVVPAGVRLLSKPYANAELTSTLQAVLAGATEAKPQI